MCGIIGFSNFSSEELLHRMSKSISHRGPDACGHFLDSERRIGLAHRRLTIIDLNPAGNQPMVNEDGSVVIVYNGELYNYKELRSPLVQNGHKFRSQTDTEVLVHLYEEHGPAMLEKLNGIFAFAIWDKKRNELFLARDQLGIKPLYYCQKGDKFGFASELKALLHLPFVSKDIDPVAISNHLTFLWSPSPVTMLKDVRKLSPGHAVIVREGKIQRQWKYYELPYPSTIPEKHPVEIQERIRALILQSVQRQLMSDVPLGSFLSGGLDSSSIVAAMRKVEPDKKPVCYTIRFSEKSKVEGFANDLPYARLAANHLGCDLRVVDIGPDIYNLLDLSIYHMDEPQADPAPINVHLICQQAKTEGFKVLLSGAGGDDVFSGYRRHQAQYLENYWGWWPKGLRSMVENATGRLPTGNPVFRRLRKQFEGASLPAEERMLNYYSWLPDSIRRSLFSADLGAELLNYDALSPLRDSLQNIPNEHSPLNRMLYLEKKFFLTDHNLNYTDKLSMASGVEVRVPLLDLDLISYAAGIPPGLKQHRLQSKYVFKKAMEPWLPKEVIWRSKSGFGAPISDWIKGPLAPVVEESLSKKRLQNRGWFDHANVQNLVRMNQNGLVDAAYIVWALLSMEKWAEMFLDKNPAPTDP